MIVVITIPVLLIALYFIKSEIKRKRWMKSFDLHKDMFNKYIELTEDLTMTNAKLKEWLPIFEEADKICARDCPDKNFEPISLKLKKIINDEESLQN